MIISINELVFIHYPLNSIECAHYDTVLYFPQGAHREKRRHVGLEMRNPTWRHAAKTTTYIVVHQAVSSLKRKLILHSSLNPWGSQCLRTGTVRFLRLVWASLVWGVVKFLNPYPIYSLSHFPLPHHSLNVKMEQRKEGHKWDESWNSVERSKRLATFRTMYWDWFYQSHVQDQALTQNDTAS